MPHARPFAFFALTFSLSIPFWVLGAIAGRDLLPGLPLSAVMVAAPATAALVLLFQDGGLRAIVSLLRRAFDVSGMSPRAWAFAIGTMPLVMLLSGVWLVASGQDLPALRFDPAQMLALFALFFIAATAEELGWSGYAARPLYAAHSLVVAGAILGAVTVLWHIIPLLQAGRAWEWIAWWALGAMARRIIILWLFAHHGQNVFAASLFHTMSNVSWMMFPVMGSHYDPVSTAIVLVCIAAALIFHDARSARGRRAGRTSDKGRVV